MHLSFNAVVELSPTGEVIGTTGTATDVSDLVRYAAELERSEERYRLLFENATEPIGVAQDGRIVFFNRAVIERKLTRDLKNRPPAAARCVAASASRCPQAGSQVVLE